MQKLVLICEDEKIVLALNLSKGYQENRTTDNFHPGNWPPFPPVYFPQQILYVWVFEDVKSIQGNFWRMICTSVSELSKNK